MPTLSSVQKRHDTAVLRPDGMFETIVGGLLTGKSGYGANIAEWMGATSA